MGAWHGVDAARRPAGLTPRPIELRAAVRFAKEEMPQNKVRSPVGVTSSVAPSEASQGVRMSGFTMFDVDHGCFW